ncbi:hypothetical protein LCGC14_2811420 [marine sediment metagenome]|uniref:Uncharacterized protein n=1 Tax=marine sediment metagenome TaxID=412755 RepID=A0A0F9AT59_9ZZZZ
MKKNSQREIMSELNRRVREGRETRKVSKGAMKGSLTGIGFAVVDERTKEKAS